MTAAFHHRHAFVKVRVSLEQFPDQLLDFVNLPLDPVEGVHSEKSDKRDKDLGEF
jgi:hypothetical protein